MLEDFPVASYLVKSIICWQRCMGRRRGSIHHHSNHKPHALLHPKSNVVANVERHGSDLSKRRLKQPSPNQRYPSVPTTMGTIEFATQASSSPAGFAINFKRNTMVINPATPLSLRVKSALLRAPLMIGVEVQLLSPLQGGSSGWTCSYHRPQWTWPAKEASCQLAQ